MLALLGLGGCAAADSEAVLGPAGGFYGAVVSEAPRAALIARDILTQGGGAADAAAALYLGLAVTRPGVAGLGGGAVCLVFDPERETVETLDFRPTPDRPVPGVARGLYALSARYGRLPWERLVTPAEQLARFGFPASRALVSDVNALPAGPARRQALRALGVSGGALREGMRLTNVPLSSLLGALRSNGPGVLYGGSWGQGLVADAQAAGVGLNMTDLRSFQPVWRASLSVAYENEQVHFTAPPPAVAEAALLPDAETAPRRRRELARALGQRAAELKGVAPAVDLGRSGFAVVDPRGGAVACETTMNGAFGSARVAAQSGVLLAGDRPATPGLGPVMMVNHNVWEFRLAATGGGGPGGIDALRELWDRLIGDRPPNPALDAAARGGVSGVIQCDEGLPGRPDTCRLSADADGNGLAVIAQ